MRVGFTGTREGMTKAQTRSLAAALVGANEFHHGMCVGADQQAHVIARDMEINIIGHPPLNKRLMMDVVPSEFFALRAPYDYHIRNRGIVLAADCLFAAPIGPEVIRSGTWSTVRFAREKGIPVAVFWPSGKVSGEFHGKTLEKWSERLDSNQRPLTPQKTADA